MLQSTLRRTTDSSQDIFFSTFFFFSNRRKLADWRIDVWSGASPRLVAGNEMRIGGKMTRLALPMARV